MILSYAFGIGVFSLPHACAVLGWLHFSVLLVVNLGGWIFSASLYIGIYKACPEAKTLPDVAYHAFGVKGQSIAGFLQIGFNVLFAASFHLTLAISLSDAVGGHLSKFATWALVGLVMLVILQARDLESLAFLSSLGAAGIILPCIGLLVYFFMQSSAQPVVTEAVAIVPWHRSITAYMNIVFSYAGQHIWIDVQSQCRDARSFRAAVAKATVCITGFYVLVSLCAYFYLGKDTLELSYPVTHYIENKWIQSIIGVLVMIHCAIGYYVCGHVFARCCEQWLAPFTGYCLSCSSVKDNLSERFLFTACFVAIAFIISFAVPFFTDILAMSTAVFLVILTYTFPLTIILQISPLTRFKKSLYVFLTVASLGLLVAGVVSSAMTTIEDLRQDQ